MAAPEDTRLVLDVMVGGLTTVLRMCGYDTAYALDRRVEDDDAIIDLAVREGRTIVTRDREIAERVGETILLTETDTDEQLRELHAAGFELELAEPGRCSRCNSELVRIREGPGPDEGPASNEGPNPDDEPVWRCTGCGQHFWKGSHWDDVRARLETLE